MQLLKASKRRDVFVVLLKDKLLICPSKGRKGTLLIVELIAAAVTDKEDTVSRNSAMSDVFTVTDAKRKKKYQLSVMGNYVEKLLWGARTTRYNLKKLGTWHLLVRVVTKVYQRRRNISKKNNL